jgi:hypothetical protein
MERVKTKADPFVDVLLYISLALAIVYYLIFFWAWNRRRDEREAAFFEELRAANEGRPPRLDPKQSAAETIVNSVLPHHRSAGEAIVDVGKDTLLDIGKEVAGRAVDGIIGH